MGGVRTGCTPLSYVAVCSRGKRGWIIECTAAFTIISPPPLIRKHAARAGCATGISLIFSPHPTRACFYTGGSSYVNEPHRLSSAFLGFKRAIVSLAPFFVRLSRSALWYLPKRLTIVYDSFYD